MGPFTLSRVWCPLVLVAVLLLTFGCTPPGQPSLRFDTPRIDQSWLEKQKLVWNHQVPLADDVSIRPILRSATAAGDTVAWIQQRSDQTELWYSENGNKVRLLSRTAPQGLLACALSPDGKKILLQAKDSSGDLYERGVLLLIEVSTGREQVVSRTASDRFEASWCGDNAFLYAEIQPPDRVAVFLARSAEQKVKQLEFRSAYPRLVLNRLWPAGWLISDRSQPEKLHGWVSQDEHPGTWTEIWSDSGQARLVGQWGGRLVLVTDDGQSSRVLLKDNARLSGKTTQLDLKGEALARLGRVRFASLKDDALYVVTEVAWGQQLQRVLLESATIETLNYGGPSVIHKPRLENGHLLVTTEAPSSPPRVMEIPTVGLEPKVFFQLEGDEPAGFRVRLEGERAVLSDSKSRPSVPILLEAYGGFGHRLGPAYDSVREEWIRRGGTVVVLLWSGRSREQEKSRDRLISEARTLKAPTVYRGTSFGATLGLMAMIEEPRLFQSLWLEAPVTDLLHFDLSPPGESWIPELGDPGLDRDRLSRISPLANLGRDEYPLTLVTTAETDYVVDPRHSYRLVERAQLLNPKTQIYLGTPALGGHGFLRADRRWETAIVDRLWSEALKRSDKV